MDTIKVAQRKVRLEIINHLSAPWLAVTGGGGDCSILTSPDGKLGTVSVVIDESWVFSIVLNRIEARRRGSYTRVQPTLSPQTEVTFAKNEIPLYVTWCADWLVAATENPPRPSPTPLATSTWNRVQTVEAIRLLKKSCPASLINLGT